MDDFNFWWYIIAAVIYFLTRGKKKKQPNRPSRPGSENSPAPDSRPKSFEELLREITEGTSETEVDEPIQQPVETASSRSRQGDPIKDEGKRRLFADDESKRVYEESIKMAEGADIEFKPSEHFQSARLFKHKEEESEPSFVDELMDGFDADEAKKAVIYSEIFNRKY